MYECIPEQRPYLGASACRIPGPRADSEPLAAAATFAGGGAGGGEEEGDSDGFQTEAQRRAWSADGLVGLQVRPLAAS